MKKRQIRWGAVVLVIGLGIILAIPASRITVIGVLRGEPCFRGRPASYWFHAVREETGTGQEAARKALQGGGPASLPVVLKMHAWDGGAFQPSGSILQQNSQATDRKVFSSALVEALRHGDKDVRLHAAHYLAKTDRLSKGPAAIPVLVEALKDKTERNRFYAVEGLYRLGEFWAFDRRHPGHVEKTLADAIKSAVPALTESLNDESSRVHLLAASTLVNLGEGESAMPTLVNALESNDSNHRFQAADALGRIGGKANAAVPQLVRMLQDEHGAARATAALALWRIDKHETALPALIRQLADGNPVARDSAAYGLGQMRTAALPAVPALLKALKVDNGFVSGAVARALLHVTAIDTLEEIAVDDSAVPAFVVMLKEEDPSLRRLAARFLGRARPVREDVVSALCQALDRGSSLLPGSMGTQMAVAQALGEIGPDAKAAVPSLQRVLKERVPSPDHLVLRVRANLALWKITGHEAAVPALIDAVNSKHPDAGFAREVAAEALGQIGPAAKAAVPALEKALKDRNAPIRIAVALALWRIEKRESVIPELVDAVKGMEVRLSIAAAESLGQIGALAKAAVPALVERLKSQEQDQQPDDDVRYVYARALRRIDPMAWPPKADRLKPP